MYDDEQGATQLYNHEEALGTEWSVNVSDDDTRNMTAMEVATLYLQGTLSAEDTYVWRDGMGDWVPLGQAEELQTVIAQVQGIQTGPTQAQPAIDEGDFGSTQIADVPGAAESPFAGTMMMNEGDHPGDDDPFAAARPAAPEPEPEDKLVGARNEASTLFSLDDLKKQADQRASRRGAKKPPEDDDPLAAIMSAPSSGGGFGAAFAPPPVHAPAPPPPPPKPAPAPIPSAPPPGAHPSMAPAQAHASMAPMPMSQAPQQKSNKGLIIGVAAAIFLLVAGVGAFAAFGGGDEAAPDKTAQNETKPADEKKAEADDAKDETPTATTDEGSDAKDAKDDDKDEKDDGKDEDEDKDDKDDKDDDKKVASNSSTTSSSSVSSGDDKKDPEPEPTTKKKKKKKKDDAAKEPGKFNPDAARSALGGAAGAASGCKKKGGPTGRGRVTVTFAPSGRATQATVGPPFAGTAVGSCAAAAFRSARVPPFTGSPVTVSKSFFIK